VGGYYSTTSGVLWGTGEAANYNNWYPGFPKSWSGYLALLVGYDNEPLAQWGYDADSTKDWPYMCEEDLA